MKYISRIVGADSRLSTYAINGNHALDLKKAIIE